MVLAITVTVMVVALLVTFFLFFNKRKQKVGPFVVERNNDLLLADKGHTKRTATAEEKHKRDVKQITDNKDKVLAEIEGKLADLPEIDLSPTSASSEEIAEAWNTFIEERKNAEQKNSK